MELQITLTRDSVFAGVARRMEWQGTRGPLGQDEYGRVALSESDRSLLHSLFDEAAIHAIDLCRPFLTAAANTDSALTLDITLPADAEATGLPMAIENMVCSHVMAQWQEIASPERAEASFAKRDDYASKALAILYHHRAPCRIRVKG